VELVVTRSLQLTDIVKIYKPNRSPQVQGTSNDYTVHTNFKVESLSGHSCIITLPLPVLYEENNTIPLAVNYIISSIYHNQATKKNYTNGPTWPTTLRLSLLYYRTSTSLSDTMNSMDNVPQNNVDFQSILRSISYQYYALSWLNVSVHYPQRKYALPYHFVVARRLEKMLKIAMRTKQTTQSTPNSSTTI